MRPLLISTIGISVCACLAGAACGGADDGSDARSGSAAIEDGAEAGADAGEVVDQCAADNPKKMSVCHVPPGNPANAHTICISKNAVDKHLAKHGDGEILDHVGPCEPAGGGGGDDSSGSGSTSSTTGAGGAATTTTTSGAGGSGSTGSGSGAGGDTSTCPLERFCQSDDDCGPGMFCDAECCDIAIQ